jgi:hypothetical protein
MRYNELMHERALKGIDQHGLEAAILRVLTRLMPPANNVDSDQVRYLTFARATAKWGPSRPTWYALIGAGKVRAIKIGGRTLLDAASIEALYAGAPLAAIAPPRRRKLLQPASAPAPAASDTRRADRRRIRQAGDGVGVQAPA